jgi:hypothetical protein
VKTLPANNPCHAAFTANVPSAAVYTVSIYLFMTYHIPAGFTPENQDGEVAEFQLMDIPSIIEAMLTGRFMNDAMLVTLDGLLQRGFITASSELGAWLLAQRC